jgi:hypothetical protein
MTRKKERGGKNFGIAFGGEKRGVSLGKQRDVITGQTNANRAHPLRKAQRMG